MCTIILHQIIYFSKKWNYYFFDNTRIFFSCMSYVGNSCKMLHKFIHLMIWKPQTWHMNHHLWQVDEILKQIIMPPGSAAYHHLGHKLVFVKNSIKLPVSVLLISKPYPRQIQTLYILNFDSRFKIYSMNNQKHIVL